MSFRISEQSIENSILQYLKIYNIFAWKVKNVGIYDSKINAFRTNKNITKGVADIIGIYMGKPLAIEVKRLGGWLRPEQQEFLDRFQAEGGIAFVAHSVEEVDQELAKVRKSMARAALRNQEHPSGEG